MNLCWPTQWQSILRCTVHVHYGSTIIWCQPMCTSQLSNLVGKLSARCNAQTLAADLQTIGRELPGTLVFDYPSVPAMTAHLHSLLAPDDQAADAAPSQLLMPGALGLHHTASAPGTTLIALHIAARMPQLLPAASAASRKAAAGGDAVGTASLQRWDLDGMRDGVHPLRVRFGGFISSVDAFDAAAFGITPPEAQLMDPQQRLLMEVRLLRVGCRSDRLRNL